MVGRKMFNNMRQWKSPQCYTELQTAYVEHSPEKCQQ